MRGYQSYTRSRASCLITKSATPKILLSQYPDKAEMEWPTYLVCDSPEGEFQILGEVKSGHPKGEFRSKLQVVLATVEQASLN